MLDAEVALPKLRSDIQLNEAPPEPEGSPTWTLYDPAANKYYKIGWLEFECLVRFKNCRSASELLKKIKKETTLEPDEDTIKDLIQFLIQHHLVHVTEDETLQYFDTLSEKMKKPWWERLVHGYLFFMVPLFKPQKFLKATYPIISPLFSRQFMMAVFLLLGYGIFLSIQRLDEMAATFMNYLSFEGLVLFLGATIVVKIIHELGHAYTATKYGVPVTTIGLAFIVLYPILYTETTNAWKLQNRKDRLIIAGGGLMAEITLAAVTLLLWHTLSPGMAQSLCFMIAVISMLASLLVNLNPLMKFDGYYLFSDLVGIDNLQDRSFAFAKWRLRKFLWGWNDNPPEIVRAEKRRFLIGFGYAVWIYRFFLYIGIAFLIYHLFFQPLGLILTLIELAFFLGLPILREVKVWAGRFGEIILSLRGIIPLLLFTFLFLLAFVPIRQSVEIPAVLHTKNYARLYAPIPAKIEVVNVAQGQKVEKGETLFQLSSNNLNHNIEITRQRLKDLEEIRESSQATPELAKKRVMIDSEIEIARQEMDGYLEIEKKLNIVAPFSGTVKIMDSSLKPGQWISDTFMLTLLTDDDTKILSGYVHETDLDILSESHKGKFYVEYSPFQRFDVVLSKIEKTGSNQLFWSELSSPQGGAIPAERTEQGYIQPLPNYTVYPVSFTLSGNKKTDLLPNFIARGTVHLNGERESLANTLFEKGFSIFIRDRGF